MTADLAQRWSLREAIQEADGEDLLSRSRRRIAETDGDVRAWVALDDDSGVQPDMVDGPLAGVPFGVKDIIDLRGLPTRCGSALRRDAAPAEADAAIVTRWRATGALPVGKTATTEFAYFSPAPTANPAAPGHTPGGSSSGSAAAVAAGHVPLALGSQTAGSVTRPAAFCGVAALVMTRGRESVDGVVGLSHSLDAHGVFAAGTDDLAVAWSAFANTPAPLPETPRVLVWNGSDLGPIDRAMRDGLARAVRRAGDAGATVTALTDDRAIIDLARAHPIVMAYEAARLRRVERENAAALSQPLRELLERGWRTPDDEYERARAVIRSAGDVVADLAGDHDVILGPAALGPAPAGLDATGDPILSRPWQALGLPVVTIPGLRDDAGLPLGMQAIGRAGGEAQLLAASAWLETNATRLG